MYYELYIDVLFLVNFMMDYILLLLVRKMLKCTATHGNVFMGAMTGSFLTCLIIVLPISHVLPHMCQSLREHLWEQSLPVRLSAYRGIIF